MAIPSFATIRDRVLADIDSSMAADGSVRGVVETAVGFAVAGASLLIHGAIDTESRNRVPITAVDAVKRLWSVFFGITPKVATYHVGTATFAATSGTSIAAGWTVRLRTGVEFTVDTTANESGGEIDIAYTATVAGIAGRSAAGTPIFLGSPISGVTSEGVVTGDGISGGFDAESTESVFARLLDRLRTPPRGGADGDYRFWALSQPGITRAWERTSYTTPSVPVGVVRVFIATDDDPLGPIPTSPVVDSTQDAIDDLRPVTVPDFLVLAPAAYELDLTIALTIETGAVLADVKAAIETSLEEMILRESEPGVTLPRSKIVEAISAAAGEYSHVLTAPSGDVDIADNELIVMGDVTWS